MKSGYISETTLTRLIQNCNNKQNSFRLIFSRGPEACQHMKMAGAFLKQCFSFVSLSFKGYNKKNPVALKRMAREETNKLFQTELHNFGVLSSNHEAIEVEHHYTIDICLPHHVHFSFTAKSHRIFT